MYVFVPRSESRRDLGAL